MHFNVFSVDLFSVFVGVLVIVNDHHCRFFFLFFVEELEEAEEEEEKEQQHCGITSYGIQLFTSLMWSLLCN